jgi:hypothetical protein
MKKKALQVEFKRKEEEMARREAMLKEEAMRQNPTSLQGRIGGWWMGMLRWVYDCVSFEWDVKPDNQVLDPLQCKCQTPNRNRLLLFIQSLTTTATCAVLPYFVRKFPRFAQS